MKELDIVWVSERGYKCFVRPMSSLGMEDWYCGSVGVPQEHPLHGADYDTAGDALDGLNITYAGYRVPDDRRWYFGLDTAGMDQPLLQTFFGWVRELSEELAQYASTGVA